MASSSTGEKEGMALSRLRKVALRAAPMVTHHCWMWGIYRMLGDVRLASQNIYRIETKEEMETGGEKERRGKERKGGVQFSWSLVCSFEKPSPTDCTDHIRSEVTKMTSKGPGTSPAPLPTWAQASSGLVELTPSSTATSRVYTLNFSRAWSTAGARWAL